MTRPIHAPDVVTYSGRWVLACTTTTTGREPDTSASRTVGATYEPVQEKVERVRTLRIFGGDPGGDPQRAPALDPPVFVLCEVKMGRVEDLRNDYDRLGALLDAEGDGGKAASLVRERRLLGELLESLEAPTEVSVVDQLAARRSASPGNASRRRKPG